MKKEIYIVMSNDTPHEAYFNDKKAERRARYLNKKEKKIIEARELSGLRTGRPIIYHVKEADLMEEQK